MLPPLRLLVVVGAKQFAAASEQRLALCLTASQVWEEGVEKRWSELCLSSLVKSFLKQIVVHGSACVLEVERMSRLS